MALSGETLAINGEPLKRFRVSLLGLSVLVVPVKIHQEVIGLLGVVRKTNRPFESTVQPLLEAVADYTSISLVNTHLFRALQEGSDTSQAGEKKMAGQLQELQQELQSLLQSAITPIDLLLAGKIGSISREQKEALKTAQSSLKRAVQLSTTKWLSPSSEKPKPGTRQSHVKI